MTFTGVSHFDIIVGISSGAIRGELRDMNPRRIQKLGALGVAGNNGYLVGLVECQMGIDEHQEICYRIAQR